MHIPGAAFVCLLALWSHGFRAEPAPISVAGVEVRLFLVAF
jgi:hypothetical protein